MIPSDFFKIHLHYILMIINLDLIVQYMFRYKLALYIGNLDELIQLVALAYVYSSSCYDIKVSYHFIFSFDLNGMNGNMTLTQTGIEY